MTTRLLASNALTAALVALLWLLHANLAGMLVWLLLLSGYLLAMLWWLIEADSVEHRLLPRDHDEPLYEVPKFPPHYTERTNVVGAPPFRFVGASERRGNRPPRPNPTHPPRQS